MSAAQWRRAMNSGASRYATARQTTPPAEIAPRVGHAPGLGSSILEPMRGIRLHHLIVLAVLIAYPLVASPFFAFQIGGQSLALGLIALSLSFLGGQGGMVSLAQQSVAGVAGYMVAIFGTSIDPISLHWPWWLAVVTALLIATLFATFVVMVLVLAFRPRGILGRPA